MLVPFGTHVLDKDGKSVGTVSRLVLHPESREVTAIVVHQGIVNRREIVVPLSKVASFGDEVRLNLSASELAGFDLFGAPSLKPMPDHWPMPAGFDLRSFFLVGGDGWTAAVLPFVLTSPTVSGTPAYIKDPDAPEGVLEPAIAASTPVYDNAGQRIGDVEGMEIDPASGRITRVIVRRGVIFRRETAIPASVIASVGDRITLSVGADEVKKLERPIVGEPGPAHSR
jgi:sporulation protein YlmC with PRC-barrel domain